MLLKIKNMLTVFDYLRVGKIMTVLNYSNNELTVRWTFLKCNVKLIK